jgi:membrane-anchored glycerophosphoryl diester phosphodiesterase (GDPDase)
MNPIDALRQSWRTTKGNSLMLFLFYVLLILAIAVISFILSMVTGLIFALTGPQAALYGNGFVSSLVNAATAALMAAVVVSVYLQLTGGGSAAVSETFE